MFRVSILLSFLRRMAEDFLILLLHRIYQLMFKTEVDSDQVVPLDFIYVIDLGSAHGTFVANERLTKATPVELEVGQSLRFAASTRNYILRKNNAALFPRPPPPTEINLPPLPDPSDEEVVVAYNTLINRYGLSKSDLLFKSNVSGISSAGTDESTEPERATERMRKLKVTFRDQAGGEQVEVVGISDGADVETGCKRRV
ncbi:hypothetical protein REPUB_Repub13aG0282300 [Reevesia pubescens]